jgi:hypothetical protein
MNVQLTLYYGARQIRQFCESKDIIVHHYPLYEREVVMIHNITEQLLTYIALTFADQIQYVDREIDSYIVNNFMYVGQVPYGRSHAN